MDRAGKRRAVSAEDAQRYRDTANDHERVNRVFQDKYATLFPSVKCTIYKCDKDECVLSVFTKGFDLKENKTTRARGSIKGYRYGRSTVSTARASSSGSL